MPLLTNENHLHLYGCLSAEDLFKESFQRAKKYDARFQWFLSEYKKATSIVINPESWWNHSDGFDQFKRHFVCGAVNKFDIFQAKFNLLIALFPPSPDDLTLADCVFAAHAKETGYKEYRTFLPLYLPPHERAKYLQYLINCARSYETHDYHPRLAISFSRQDAEAWDSYGFLMGFMADNPDLKPWLTGIDFCGNERGHPPTSKKKLFEQINHDRLQGHHSLEILYHVGEMWENVALHSAARWCLEATEIGVRRLGHALALGMAPEALCGRTIHESTQEAKAHLTWLRAWQNELSEGDYTTKDYEWLSQRIEANTNNESVAWHYDEDLVEHTRRFQSAALSVIKLKNPIIESCPTSNIRIGALGKPSFHPLQRFLEHGLHVTIATDDPGIFDINLEHEENLIKRQFKINDEDLKKAEKLSASLFKIEPK